VPVPASEPLVGPFDRVLIRVPKTLACWKNN
jgi:16S rRNA (guanine1207-N2)-methyltransferase